MDHPLKDPWLLRANLCFQHGLMRASEELLQCAYEKAESESLNNYFRDHYAEEKGHIIMLDNDLHRLGIHQPVEFPQAAQIAGAQYYYIFHDHPALLLGYMMALECNPASIEFIDELEAIHGPLTCLRYHAIHDPDHIQGLRDQVERLYPGLRARVLRNKRWVEKDLVNRVVPTIHKVAKAMELENA